MSLSGLRRAGVLGINRRNARYTLRWNDRRRYPLVDDKLATKRLCEAAGIPIPRILATATQHHAVRGLIPALEGEESFVLKPARGALGNGIVVVTGRQGGWLRRASGRRMSESDFRYHAAGIISGLYSLGGHADAAIVEERLRTHPRLERLVAEGVPDVRVVVYCGIPVMAMTRLPTRRSGGRANLHQGAIGAGIDLSSGRVPHAVLRNRPVSLHPDTGESVIGARIPSFERVLEIAVAATDETGLGYVGADVVVDLERGPVILELNARPGLSIQIANRAGLRPRLDGVDAAWRAGRSVAERVALAREIARASGPRAPGAAEPSGPVPEPAR